jgi:hypothetical protein
VSANDATVVSEDDRILGRLADEWNSQVLDFICGLALEVAFEHLGYDDERLTTRIAASLPPNLRGLNGRYRTALLQRRQRSTRAFVVKMADVLLADLLKYPAR